MVKAAHERPQLMSGSITRRAGVAWLALGVSIVVTAAAMIWWMGVSPTSPLATDAGIYLAAAVVSGIAGSVSVFVASTATSVRITMVVRLALLLVVARSESIGLVPSLLLTLSFLLDIGISERYPVNLITTLVGASLIAVVFRSSADATLGAVSEIGLQKLGLERVALAVVAGTTAVVFSLATHYREDLIREQRHADRLDSALKRLSEANIGYQEYASRAEQMSMLEERKRITREIHDTIGYTMTNNIMMMEAAAEMVRRDPDGVERLMEKARASAQEGLDEIRNALHLLRAQESPAPSSIDAIVKMIAAFRDATGTEVELELGNTPIRLNAEIESAVYHSVREALTNSFRHGKATRVRVQFWKSDAELTVVVWDNGVGSGEDIQEGIGLSGMRERLREVSGTLRVEPLPMGFQIVATIPESGGSCRR